MLFIVFENFLNLRFIAEISHNHKNIESARGFLGLDVVLLCNLNRDQTPLKDFMKIFLALRVGISVFLLQIYFCELKTKWTF